MFGLMKGHPKGLSVLFFAEMWERLSYYGMRGLLVLYMTKEFGFSDTEAYAVYGAYTALVYTTPIIGGLLADRILGMRKAVILGGILMSVGHFAMAFNPLFYLGLAFIIVGNGFFKPNISTIVGALYKPGDAKRDAGFTIFYMGINIGAALQLVAGILGERVGWHYGFGFAGVGMVLGLIVFWLGQGRLEGKAEPPKPEKLTAPIEWGIYAGSVALVFICYLLVQSYKWTGYIVPGSFIGLGVILFVYGLMSCNGQERSKLYAAMIMILASSVFWMFFEQAGSSINLFTDRNVDRMVFGWEVPTTWFQSVNAIFIIMFAPVFSWLWVTLDSKKKEPNTPLKFGLGIFQLGLGFGALWMGAQTASEGGYTSMLWVILGYLLHTTGELCLSPIGLSMITKLSPVRIVSLMMGMWFLGIAFAQYIAAAIAKLTGASDEGGEGVTDPAVTIDLYGNVFGQIAVTAVVFGIFMVLVSPLIRKMMKDVH